MKRIVAVVLVLVLVLGALPLPVLATAGVSTATITATNAKGFSNNLNPEKTFVERINLDSADGILGNANTTWVGWTGSGTYSIFPLSSVYEFDLTSVAGYEISSAYLKLWCETKTDTSISYSNFFFSLYNTDGGLDNALGVADLDTMLDIYDSENLAPIYQYTDMTLNAYNNFTLMDDGLANVRTGNKIYFHLASTNHALETSPTWESAKGIYLYFSAQNSAHPPQLVVTYTVPAAGRTTTIPANAAVDNTTDGTETCDNITLGTPRYMYADEDIYFLVNGSSGKAINLQLEDTAGNVLQGITQADSIRTDGNYDWTVPGLLATTDTICRARETLSGVVSTWISVKPSPSGTMPNLSVMCEETTYPPFRDPMTTWAVYTDDIMTVNWKTNINGAVELANYSLAVYPQGDNTTALYDVSLDTLMATQGGTTANQQGLGHWRYMLFTPDRDTLPDYDGLVYDLNMGYTNLNKGLICPAIHAVDGSWLTNTWSAYWYLRDDTQAMIAHVTKTSYKIGEPVSVVVNVGADCNLELRLPSVEVRLFDQAGTSCYLKNFSIDEGINSLVLGSLSGAGNYYVQLRFNGSTAYSHYQWLEFSVNSQVYSGGSSGGSGSGYTSDLGTKIKTWISDYGMDDDVGHWVIMLALMILSVVIFWKVKIMCVIMPLGILAIGMVIGWVNPVIVVLLALGAGFTIWSAFRKKADAGG